MALSSNEILERIRNGNIVFAPGIDRFQIQQHAIDLRLGFTFLIPKSWELTTEGRVAVETDHLDLSKSNKRFTLVEIKEGQVFDILPGEYVAVKTLEKIKLPEDLMAILYPRSSVNRRGLSVDLTGIVDAGYEGHLIIPVRNNTPFQVIRLYPGERFCQLVFEDVKGSVSFRQSRWHNVDFAVTIQDEESSEEMKLVREGRITKIKDAFPLL